MLRADIGEVLQRSVKELQEIAHLCVSSLVVHMHGCGTWREGEAMEALAGGQAGAAGPMLHVRAVNDPAPAAAARAAYQAR